MTVRNFTALSVTIVAGCMLSTDVSPVDFRGFDGDLLVLVDTDMPAFAYANGVLEPRVAEQDAVHLVHGGSAPRLALSVAASNTVTTWPGSIALSADGRFAYVIEGRKGAPLGVNRVDDVQEALVPGDQLTALVRADNGRWSHIARAGTARLPTGVALSPDGTHLAVSTAMEGADVQVFRLNGGMPVSPISIEIAFSGGIGPDANTITALAWHPQSDLLALNMGGNAVGFAQLLRDANGAVSGAQLEGLPVEVGRLLSVLRWSPDGRFLFALDTGWGPRPADRVLNGPGSIHVIAREDDGWALTGSVPSGRSSENFAVSRDGRFLATLNMERTYLPGGFPLGLFGGRDASSVSLFAIDSSTGLPVPLGAPVLFRGVLPQGIAFDRAGRALAVAVFQDHDPRSVAGWVEFFQLEGAGSEARLRLTNYRVETPRGAHDLAVLP